MFEFIETPFFTRALEHYLDDDEYVRLQEHLNEHPEAGALVPGSGGVRKLRWAVAGRGKRERVACHLLPAKLSRRDLDAHVIRKECAQEYSRAPPQTDERGYRR